MNKWKTIRKGEWAFKDAKGYHCVVNGPAAGEYHASISLTEKDGPRSLFHETKWLPQFNSAKAWIDRRLKELHEIVE